MSMDPDPPRPTYEPPGVPAESSFAQPAYGVEPQVSDQPSASAAQVGYTNGLAIASLVLGIAGLTSMPFIPSLLALIFGYKARAEIDRSNGLQSGRGMAVAGIVLGWIGVIAVVAGLLLLFGAFAVSFSGFGF